VEPTQPGDVLRAEFTLQDGDGAGTDADSLPTASLWRNGGADLVPTVTVTRVAVGTYTVSVTVPGSYAAGDAVAILVLAFINTVGAYFWVGRTKLVGWPATGVLDAESENGETYGDQMRLNRAVLVGATPGVVSGHKAYKSADGNTTRVAGDLTAAGARTNVTTDPTP
jgi:hypothetical protein